MGRIIGGILAGIIVALALQAAMDAIGNMIFPSPRIDNIWDKNQINAVFATRPVGALLLMALGYLVGAAVGGYVAKRISRRAWTVWVPAGLMTVFAATVVLAYSFATWARIAIAASPLIGGLIAERLSPRSKLGETPAEANADAEV